MKRKKKKEEKKEKKEKNNNERKTIDLDRSALYNVWGTLALLKVKYM